MQRTHIIRTLKKLRAYKNLSFPVLSVFLSNSFSDSGEKLINDFRKLLQETAEKDEVSLMEIQIQTIEDYLMYDYTSKKHDTGVAIFIGEKLWEIIHYDFHIPPQLVITHHPFIAPIMQELYNEGEDLVVVADKKYAKMLLFHNGVVQKQEILEDLSVPQKKKSNKGENYARSGKISRHLNEKEHQHFVYIAQNIDSFVKNEHIHAVFIGGHMSTIHPLEEQLSPMLRKKIKGEFIVSLKATQNELLRKSKHAIAHASVQ